MNISVLQLFASFSKPEATYGTIKGTFVEVVSFCVPAQIGVWCVSVFMIIFVA